MLQFTRKSKSESDSPPNNSYWIGRKEELQDIASNLHRVVFISGIGGQGKSGLASHYVKELVSKNSYWEYWDWRDCKEKENRVHGKITSAIERLSEGTIQANQLADESFDDLIEFFFSQLGDRHIVFVFDNVDAYVEFENFQLIGAIDKLYQAALNKSHSSQFIFTCRTSINDIHVQLLSIRLQGLNKEDALSLFKKYSLPIDAQKLDELAESAFSLTKGHPLWLNLIAAQARRGLDAVDKFIQGIKSNTNFTEESISSMLSGKILKIIWDNLTDNQKLLLRAFAETVRAETEQNLSKILASEITGNQFFKSFKALKQLNLIVTKSSYNELDTFELHPLVKEYVLQNFARAERSKYISLFILFYDAITVMLKSNLAPDQPLSFFENWTAKIELLINKEDYKSALISLGEVSDAISESGYTEEYIRVASLLYITIDWAHAISEEFTQFHFQLRLFIEALTDYGKFSEASAFLTKYERHLLVKDVKYINFLVLKSYFYWFQSDFTKAIEIAEEASHLDENSENKVGIWVQRRLALSLRDTKEEGNIERALGIFLNGQTLDYILNAPIDINIGGQAYGNIGRCLQFNGQIEEALVCYKKSLSTELVVLDKGYGFSWVAECLVTRNEFKNAAWFYKRAIDTWKSVSPIKATSVSKKLDALVEIHSDLTQVLAASQAEAARFCAQYLNRAE